MDKIENLSTSENDKNDKNENQELGKEENEIIIENEVIYNYLDSENNEVEYNELNELNNQLDNIDDIKQTNIELINENKILLIRIEDLKKENLELKDKLENISKIDLLLKLKENITNKIIIEKEVEEKEVEVEVELEEKEKQEENEINKDNLTVEQDINLLLRKRRGRRF
jgi:hypothetical protein